ncbi:MAG: hypothetical protein HKN84_11105, partial [Gammaproteobacteria bacterium]|nr:hypothetical protein [Gammaproteobacteria bacterium]
AGRVKLLEQSLAEKTGQIEQLEADRQRVADEHAADRGDGQVETLQHTLDQAEERILQLQSELAAANEQHQLVDRDSGSEDLHNENVRLSALVIQRDQTITALKSQLDEIEDQTRKIETWTSTVSSLENELRRKSSLIDDQADDLRRDEQHASDMEQEVVELRQQVASGEEELESLRNLLDDARAVVLSLREELDEKQHAQTRERLSQDPLQDPAGLLAGAIDPREADIESLRFTARSRRELADSLDSILAEERGTLDRLTRDSADREQMLLSLQNEIAANRITIASMHGRLCQFKAQGLAGSGVGAQGEQLEHELHQSVRMIEQLRIDLHRWRGRIKPLHQGMLTRDNRIQHLEAELAAFRKAGLKARGGSDGAIVEDVSRLVASARDGVPLDEEREEFITEMEQQWRRIVELEAELADVSQHLARAMELDEARCREIENTDAARAVQVARINEMRRELVAVGAEPEQPPAGVDNVVDMLSRRPPS